jgi:hypothetical protein
MDILNHPTVKASMTFLKGLYNLLKGFYAYPEHWALIPATKAYATFSIKVSTHTQSTGAAISTPGSPGLQTRTPGPPGRQISTPGSPRLQQAHPDHRGFNKHTRITGASHKHTRITGASK